MPAHDEQARLWRRSALPRRRECLIVTMIQPEASIAERLTTALRTGTPLDLIPDTPQGEVGRQGDSWLGRRTHDVDAALLPGRSSTDNGSPVPAASPVPPWSTKLHSG
jgi:hypothetical protein